MNTISDVAHEAGVSVATVSRVVNNSPKVSPDALKRVNEAITKLNYSPNVWGRSLRRQESRMILVFVPNVSNPFYADIISGIEDMARQNSFNIMICITNVESRRASEYFELLRCGSADGAILLDGTLDGKTVSRMAKSYPIVQCCEYCEDLELSHVSIDNFAAAKEIIAYLLSIGHRKIGYIGAENQFISTKQREDGFISSMTAAFPQSGPPMIANADGDYNFQSGARATEELLNLENPPSAIFCISDMVALGAIKAATDRGLSVPRDLTVVGFDNVLYSTMFRPQLTTVNQPGYLLGLNACELLFQRLAGEPPRQIFLEHQLIIRDSSAEMPLNK